VPHRTQRLESAEMITTPGAVEKIRQASRPGTELNEAVPASTAVAQKADRNKDRRAAEQEPAAGAIGSRFLKTAGRSQPGIAQRCDTVDLRGEYYKPTRACTRRSGSCRSGMTAEPFSRRRRSWAWTRMSAGETRKTGAVELRMVARPPRRALGKGDQRERDHAVETGLQQKRRQFPRRHRPAQSAPSHDGQQQTGRQSRARGRSG